MYASATELSDLGSITNCVVARSVSTQGTRCRNLSWSLGTVPGSDTDTCILISTVLNKNTHKENHSMANIF
jgi:pyruvoyl-dependent arginine decarboxylase (PvlArgDC)